MSDHFSGPRAIAGPAADITDMWAFPSPQRPGHLVMAMGVLPAAKPGAHFSEAITCRFRLRPLEVAGTLFRFGPEPEELVIDCGFSESGLNGTRAQEGGCRTPSGKAVRFTVGDEQGATGDGVRVDGNGRIVVDHYYRTSAAGIYAAGDVVRAGLASNAMQQGRAAAAHACGLVFGVVVDQMRSMAVYGVPEVASVGATEEELSAAGIPYVVGRCDLGSTARGAIAGHGGLLKLIFRADDRKLLGVHCFGDIASEVVGMGRVVLHLGASVELFLTLAINTPTYTYAYNDATVDGLTRLTEVMGLADGAAAAPVGVGR